MCGRYAINQTGRNLSAALAVEWAVDEPVLPRYNVGPQTDAPVLRVRRDGTQALDSMRWGLVPSWAKDPTIGRKMVNARCESAAASGAFKWPLERRRCLVPASGFYEWTGSARQRTPHWLHPIQGELILMAGLWELWRSAPDAPALRSFTILTAPANNEVAAIHDRMPIIITPADRAAWLDPSSPPDRYLSMLASAPTGTLRSVRVSPAVNRVDADGPELLEPWTDDALELPF
jgi:putative SOS response-associated peptidase YedK